jgi:endonuclease YncB( thermonuclease family)
LGKVLLSGLDANLRQIQRGLAWLGITNAYEREQMQVDRKVYSVAESEARAAKRGLWVESAQEPPWEFSRNK